MYTEHVIETTSTEEPAYTDPGDGYIPQNWEVEFRHYNKDTQQWTNWLPVDAYGEVNQLADCSLGSDNTRIWAFGSSYVRLDQIEKTEWRVFIKGGYEGNACEDSAPAPVATEVNQRGEGALWETECTSRDIYPPANEYRVKVFHERE